MAVDTLVDLEVPRAGGPGRGGDAGPPDGGGDGGRPGGSADRERALATGMWIALAAIGMFFAALTSALVVRKGVSDDWVQVPVPAVLWLNTVVILASSATLERARRLAGGASAGRWWALTLLLGAGFLAGQLFAWQQLREAGAYVASNPASSFFYLLTAAHGVHLIGGLVAIAAVAARARSRAVVRAAATYWHFMGGLWVYVLFLIHLGGRL